MRQLRSKTYRKYLFSYIGLLLLAALALLIFSQAFFVGQLQRNLEENHRSRLRQTVQQMDSNIQSIFTIDYQISSVNQDFLTYYLEEPSPLRDLRIVNEFKNLIAPSTFISEVALVSQDEDYVYTSTAVYAKRVFFSGIFSFENWPDPAGDLAGIRTRMVHSARRINQENRYIAFIDPPAVYSRLQDASQMYFVDEARFQELLSPASAPTQQGAIWAADGTLIVSTLPLAGPLTGDRVRVDGTDYLILREDSQVMDWKLTFLLPLGEYMAPVYRAQIVLLVFLAALLTLGGFVIHYAMRMNYRPLSELALSLGATEGDELESLRDVLNDLSTQNEHMRSQLMGTPDGQGLKDILLFSLLKGKFKSFEAFNAEAGALGMTFDKPCYQVLMLRHFGDVQEVPRALLTEAIHKALGPNFTCHLRELFEPWMIVCLIGMEEGREQELYERCQALLADCARDHGLSFTIGMSDCYRGIERITTACFEATQAVREYFIRGRHQLIRYQDLDQSVYASTALLNEIQALPTLAPEAQVQSIHRLIDTLKADKVPALLARSYCNSAAQMLINGTTQAVNMDDLFAISYLRTADDYLAFMLRLVQPEQEPVLEAVASDDEPENELISRIRAYIAAHYDDCNFSLQDAADHLELSSSYLSQYFKQQTGDNLTAYVADLRIRKACALLETTTMPVQMISESVGYYNQNSFIRRFK